MNRKKGKGGHSARNRSPPGRAENLLKFDQLNQLNPDTGIDWTLYTIVFLLVLVILTLTAIIMTPRAQLAYQNVYQNHPQSNYDSRELETEEASNEEFIFSGISCEQLMDSARKILDERPLSEWEGALDLLATCALQEPENAAPRWNLAFALLQMNRGEEAVGFIDEALRLDPTNLNFLKTGGAYLSKHGHHTGVVKCLEVYLSVSLVVPSWEELLASISIQREDEWQFIYDAGEDIIQVLEMLQASYLKTTSLIKAGYLYKVLIGLKGDSVELEILGAYSSFAFGLGDIATGIKYLCKYTETQYTAQGYGDIGQAYEVVTAHSLRLLTAGFDSTINSIVKNLLSGGRLIWEELMYNCDMEESGTLNYSVRIQQSDVRKILTKCILTQGVVKQLVEKGAVLYAENIFGWTPLLHVAALGSSEIIEQILEIDPDPQSKTVLAHSALHVASIRGSYSVVEPMLRAGLKVTDKDYFNRTALKLACLQRWSAKGMARALGETLPRDCPSLPMYSPPPKLHSQGGWLGSKIRLPKELTKEKCDIDVLSVSDVETFVFDYLALQRPVLIRNVTSSQQMKSLHQRWQRNKFEQEFRALKFTEVEIPYAETFGFKTSQSTTLKKFMTKMRKLTQEQQEITSFADFASPMYIFETISLDSPILSDFVIPPVLDPDATNIDINKLQFYLGPTLSGSPVHFHRNAWNILIYGQKRWFLYPPDKAFYSKQHILDWWRDNHASTEGAWSNEATPLECVQYPGDMMFVPDMWGHGVINLKESIGLASEFVYGASEFSI